VNLSVIICTHNPRQDYLNKVLTSLKRQTLDQKYWEIILIDNSSRISLASEIDLSWHIQSKIFREDKLGLTPARLRGIQEASTEVLVFVDDDNVLDKGYLENALKFGQDWLILGAWGGQCLPNFEIEPPAWTKEFWEYLGIRSFDCDCWSKEPKWEATPIGAGLCVRKIVAEAYAHSLQNDPRRTNLVGTWILLTLLVIWG
jgi:glycosyltransferase involved in cell wall biosynthesis